jgi:hypothetical protein
VDRPREQDGRPTASATARGGYEPSVEGQPIVRAKVDARDSADESARAAKVQGLDDEVRDAFRTLAINPGAYRPGTFARLADAYDAAEATERAALARRMAAQEAVILLFAQASTEKQQRIVDDLPEGDLRNNAIAIQAHQMEAFTHDPFAAGTTLYLKVGPAVPIDDVKGRIRQARQISYLRGVPVAPLTADEIKGAPDQVESTGAVQPLDRATDIGPSPHFADPNLVLVAGNDKEKRLRLRGSANRPRSWSDDEVPEPKQLDPFAGTGGGGGFRLPRTQRPAPKSGTPKSTEPSTDVPRRFSPQETQRRREQFEENKANGRAWEIEREELHRKEKPDVGTQVTVQTPTGSRGRIDIVTRDSEGKIECSNVRQVRPPE